MVKERSLLPTNPEALDTLRAMQEARRGAAASGPRISLIVYHGENVQVITLAEGQQQVVGRDPSADVAIADESLSRRHARFAVQGGEVWVDDLGSTNGTKLNGQRVEHARMAVGDEVTLGGVTAGIHVLPPLDVRRAGLLTHDQFLPLLEEEVVRAQTFGRTAAVVMLELSGVEPHLFVGQAELRDRLRPVDHLALYGGKVLELLLPEATAAQAAEVAQALRDLAAPPASARGGVAVFPGSGTSAEELLEVCREALRRATPGEPVRLAGRPESPGGVAATGPVFRSRPMQALLESLDRVAASVIPVLLVGETGTGKEVLARALHERGPRSARRLACVNCGAIPPTLLESVLFGHERGAYTGATQAGRGVFEEANGGTLLLDEVGELSPPAQAALLRVLETRQIMRVGSSREIAVDVRVVAATHRDLEEMCVRGAFRTDLLYRLNAMTVEIPPLRERLDEIGPLVELFVRQANAANGRRVRGVQPDALRLLHHYPWPGNIRELRNAIERAVVIAPGDEIRVADLPRRVCEYAAPLVERSRLAPAPVAPPTGSTPPPPAGPAPPPPAGPAPPSPAADAQAPLDLRASVQQHEAQVIMEALQQAGGNRSEAARRLRIPLRTLSHKMQQMGIKRLGFGVGGDDE
jgi:DNA-binding NtrC family response regulator